MKRCLTICALVALSSAAVRADVTVTTEVHTHGNRRYGIRPATTVRREHVRVSAAREEAPLAHAVRRLGWRV